MQLTGKRLDLLERADECARILGHPKHEAARFQHLSAGDRGIAVALQEHFDAEIRRLREEFSTFRHTVLTRGDSE